MSTDYAPTLLNAIGRLQRFGAEETLTWDFTSAAGHPMVLLVGGATYFTFERDGSFTLEKDITWNADSGGIIGELYDHRPDIICAATTLTVGAVAPGSEGAKLELNILTLGHANVDKYIDAEQGLANTPALRYNAVNTRWEFSDDGIVYTSFSAGFGTTTWDALYSADKTLIINTTRLTFTQTSTTDVAFAFTRNLAAASTDAPILLVEQQEATDDQAALAVAQVATAASALDIYEGTQAAGTIRYGFGATGQLTITTNAVLADSAIHIVQNDTDQPFLTAEGTAGAGVAVSISTDSGATADMLQVTVDGGAGANKRWVPAYSASTLPAANTWDSIYLADKHLDINGAVLQFEQTAVTGRGFEVFRNLTAASTDAPLMVIEQQHAADDQPGLAVGQLAAAADALRIYDGSIATGTLRFQFQPQGRLNIVTNAVLASEAFRIEQNDDDVAFMEFKGTAAAGAGKNISTDSNPTADMLRVTVDVGAGGLLRWVPAYNSSTLPAPPTWDAIYAGDKILDIDTTVLTFDQSSTTGIGFVVSRNLAAVNTDSPIMRVDQNGTLDDQPALQVTGGIADIAGGVPVLDVLATSAGMGTGGDIMVGARSTVARNVGDVVATFSRAYEANVTGVVGNAVAIGLWVGPTFDSGVYCESDVVVVIPVAGNVSGISVLQNDVGENGIDIEGAGANVGNALSIDNNWTWGIMCLSPVNLAAPVNSKVLEIVPGAPTVATDFVSITAISGGLGANNITGLDIALTGHIGDTAGCVVTGIDLDFTTAGISDSRAVNINAGWDHGIYSLSPSYLAAPVNSKVLEVVPGAPTAATDFVSITATSGGLINVNATGLDIALTGHANDQGTTIISGIDLDFTTAGVSDSRAININAGWDHGVYSLSPTYLAAPVNSKVLEIVAGAPTSPTDFVSITGISGVLDAEAMRALVIGLTGNVGDLNDTPVTGIDLNYTTGGGSDLATAMVVQPGFHRGIWMDTAPSATDVSLVVCNDGVGQLIIAADGTVAGLGAGTIIRFVVAVDGGTEITADKAGNALAVTNMLAAGTGRLLRLTDGVGATVVRMDVNQNGQTTIAGEADDATLKVIQNHVSVAGNILECADGTAGAHTARFQVHKKGAVTCTPADPTENLNVFSITATSGVLDNKILIAHNIAMTTNVGDINVAQYYGTYLNMTDVGGSSTSLGLKVLGGWDRGIEVDSDPLAGEASVSICNVGTAVSYLLYLGEGTIAAPTPRFKVQVDGTMSLQTNTGNVALTVVQSGAGDILSVENTVNTASFKVNATGVADFDINDTTNGLRVGNSGAVGNLLELKDGTVAGGTQRFLVAEDGEVTISTTVDLASEALTIDQNDEDQAFIDYQGTQAVDTTKNLTSFVGGAGAVVGPLGQAVAEAYWSFTGMVKIETNGSPYWMPYYTYHAT